MIIRIFFFLFLVTNLFSNDNNSSEIWKLERYNFYYENDTFFKTDYDYTAGLRFSWLYSTQKQKDQKDHHNSESGSKTYRSFAIVHQIFTPEDTDATELIKDARPYAGWTSIEVGLHKSSKTHLSSLNMKLGVIGNISGARVLQNTIHSIIHEPKVNGWDNQLKNELGVNLKYTNKWRFTYKNDSFFESSIMPFGELEIGNISTKATVGISMRIGKNIPKDFGVSSINIGGDDGIPSYGNTLILKNNRWNYSLNIYSASSFIVRDIFLDGNTFRDSHSVKKESLIAYGGAGITARHNKFIFDFTILYNTKEYHTDDKDMHFRGSAIFSWLYD